MGKRLAIFVWVSLTFHLYLVLMILAVTSPEFQSFLKKNAILQPREPRIEETVVETVTDEKVTPEVAKISDKANPDRGKKAPENRYNYPNPDPKARMGDAKQDGKASKEEPKNEPKDASAAVEVQLQEDKNVQKREQGGDPHTSFYTTESNLSVDMQSEGDLSLATMPNEFAPYFLAMQQKVKDNWQAFFPVFQYYQGILKNGEVEVVFEVRPDGNVENARVEKSYGYRIMDDASLNAILYSRNFGKLPEKLAAKGNVTVRFRFVYMGR